MLAEGGVAWGAWAVALLLYPGLAFAVVLAMAVEWARGMGTALLVPRDGRLALGPALRAPWPALRAAWTAQRPQRGAESAWGIGGQVGLALVGLGAPLVALLLLPVPGHPLSSNSGIAPVGDGLAVWAMLLAGAGAHGVLGLGAANVGAQLAGARRLQTVVLAGGPATLALVAWTSAAHSLQWTALNAGAAPLPTSTTGLAWWLAALVFVGSLPALAGWPPADVAGLRPGPTVGDSILTGLPTPLPALVLAGALVQRAAWLATAAVLLVPGSVAGGAGAGGRFALALLVGVAVLTVWGARRLPPRPDRVPALPWTLGLPIAAVALVLLALSSAL